MTCKAILTTLLLVTGITAGAQVTTETEYKYIKNLMREIDEKGADPKRGYYVTTLTGDTYSGGNSLTAKELRRESDSTIAGTFVKIVVTGTFSGNGTFYFCIPSPSLQSMESYGWDSFYTDLTAAGNTCKDVFLRWVAQQYSIQKYYLNSPQKKRRAN